MVEGRMGVLAANCRFSVLTACTVAIKLAAVCLAAVYFVAM